MNRVNESDEIVIPPLVEILHDILTLFESEVSIVLETEVTNELDSLNSVLPSIDSLNHQQIRTDMDSDSQRLGERETHAIRFAHTLSTMRNPAINVDNHS
jgi:hypothetical protein